jgi:hypothetical protein
MNQKNNNFSICNLTRWLSIDTYRTNNGSTIDKFGSIHFYSRIYAFAFEGQAIQDSVFEIVNVSPEFISIILNDTKITFDTSPAEHMFMVVGESANFLKAILTDTKFKYDSKEFVEMQSGSKFVKSGLKAKD